MVDTIVLESKFLERNVRVDFYEAGEGEERSLLLINDGQDLLKMQLENLLSLFTNKKLISPLLIAGIHCGPDRINEYGMSSGPDYAGRGAKGKEYHQFILTELLPAITDSFGMHNFKEKAFAGFSLGGLSALDITWNHPEIFSKAGVFSGSLWWRSMSQNDREYNQATHRMMYAQIRSSKFHPGLKFFFECGELDETMDRNKNGVIDSIDDTIDLMRELVRKGYRENSDIFYLQMPDGRHDVASWEKALPMFLKWGWG